MEDQSRLNNMNNPLSSVTSVVVRFCQNPLM
jgi:hypothetical protein